MLTLYKMSLNVFTVRTFFQHYDSERICQPEYFVNNNYLQRIWSIWQFLFRQIEITRSNADFQVLNKDKFLTYIDVGKPM